jgi:hypothetical protein
VGYVRKTAAAGGVLSAEALDEREDVAVAVLEPSGFRTTGRDRTGLRAAVLMSLQPHDQPEPARFG